MKKIKISKREKKFLIACCGVAVFIVLWLGWDKFSQWQHSIEVDLEGKHTRLEKMIKKAAKKPKLEKDVKNFKRILKGVNKNLLTGNTPSLAAADLQRELKKMTSRLGIEVKSDRPGKIIEMDMFTQIPVDITVKTTISKLKDFLFQIENSSISLSITDLMIRVTNRRDPKDVEAKLTVVGLTSK